MQNVGQLWNGHTGFTTENYGNYQATIEGNTNKAGSRNGDRVAERERPTNSILAVIRWSDNVQINYTAQLSCTQLEYRTGRFCRDRNNLNTISCHGCLRTGTNVVSGGGRKNYSRFLHGDFPGRCCLWQCPRINRFFRHLLK